MHQYSKKCFARSKKSTTAVAKKNAFTKQIKLARDIVGGLVAIFYSIIAISQNDCSKNIIFLQCKCAENMTSKIISFCNTNEAKTIWICSKNIKQSVAKKAFTEDGRWRPRSNINDGSTLPSSMAQHRRALVANPAIAGSRMPLG
jgi:hypothetical protein